MTERTAEKIANVALGAAALRRMAIGLAVTALTGALPAWLTREAQHAWVQSRRRGI